MNERVSRRRFLKGAAAVGAVATGPSIITRQGWSQTGPIKIGVLEIQSGPVKYIGDGLLAGVRFGIERVNGAGGALGRRIELLIVDHELRPDVATRRANDLLFGEKVDILAGGTASHVVKAVSQVAAQHKKVFISYTSEAAELTGAEFLRTTFRCCLNSDMHAALLARYVGVPSRNRRFYLLNQDYSFGRAVAHAFKKRLIQSADQQIVGEAYHPLQKVQDFGPYITNIMASGADVLMTADWGQDLRLLVQQGAALGWNVKLVSFFLNDPTVLQAVQSAAVGHVTGDMYLITADTPANSDFLAAWRHRYPDAPLAWRWPDLKIAFAFQAMLWLGDVIRRAGQLETDALIAAWEGARLKTVWGEVEMRPCDHQVQTPGYVAEIMQASQIPQAIRYFGQDFPYIGPATMISRENITVSPKETGNARCV
jgi:branched-chain amino acid transport system substrate-binding protein